MLNEYWNEKFERPNLFKNAPSELSQDAFICWLLEWANYPDEDPILHKCALEFISSLYNLGSECKKVDFSDVSLHKGPKTQYHYIDIYFQARIGGKTISFVIEDKTSTTLHSNQLARYEKIVEKDNIKEDERVLVYFKTGFLLPNEIKEVKKAGYKIYRSKDFYELLKDYPTDSDVFENFKEYLRFKFYEPLENDFRAFRSTAEPKERKELLQKQHVQVQFLEHLLTRLSTISPNTINYPLHPSENLTCKTHSRTGRYFSHLWFAYANGVYPDDRIEEYLHYRLDHRSGNRPYLALRLYAEVEGKASSKSTKVERLRKFIAMFEPIYERPSISLSFGKVTADNSGHNDSEIAVLFLDEPRNSPVAILDELPSLHMEFVQAVLDSGLMES